MTEHVLDQLVEYAAGTLGHDEAAAVEAHLPRCNLCARELAVIDEVFAQLALALPAPPVAPELRAQILSSLTPLGRFEKLAGRVANILDVTLDRAEALLEWIDTAGRWIAGPHPSMIMHLPGGPAVAHANCGFVRLAAGQTFPLHRHLGEEHVLVLQGGYEDSDGATLRQGDESFKPPGSEHSFTALPGADLIYLVVLETGIEIPSDPGFQL